MKNLLLVIVTALCFVLASCGSSCVTCESAGTATEICEDDYEALATADGIDPDSVSFDQYIEILEAFGVECN